MVSDTQDVAAPAYYGPMPRPGISEEQIALADFAWRLGSSNCTSEGPNGIVDETRQDAELLMSLLLSPRPALHGEDDIPESEPVSCSGSYSSESSCGSSSRRENFSFTCPSLSLENPVFSNSSQGQCSLMTRTVVVNTYNNNKKGDSTKAAPPPALLLGRPLKVDDRDALRLSADAMARNVLQSFQKAMDWRLQVWMEAICKQLAQQEKIMLQDGASMEEIKKLLETPEAALVVLLRQLADDHKIAVNSVNTSFQVLPQRVNPKTEETQQPQERRYSLDSTSTASSLSQDDHQGSHQESAFTNASLGGLQESDYLYTVGFKLEFTCDIYVETPAGLTEITLKVPGSVQGKFLSNEVNPAAELRSVEVNLDTDCLAKMVEKGCRTVVRTSVEKALAELSQDQETEEEEANGGPEETITTHEPKESTPSATATATDLLSSPNAYASSTAVITPHNATQNSYDGLSSCMPKALFPIPDDFSGSSRRTPAGVGPKTPPPPASASLPIKRGSPPTTTDEERAAKRRLPLISPPGNKNHGQFHEVKEDGPSLPMLVEVACRAMRVD